jgi:aminoglycoside phosphotransferase (APT) family kinase protein
LPDHPLEDRLAALLTRLHGATTTVDSLSRFHGGAARETWRLRATTGGTSNWLVMRRDPASSLIDTSRAAEFHVLGRAFAAGLPVPEPLHLDNEGRDLGAPGFLMREVAGGRAASPFEPEPYGQAAPRTGEALFGALGRLHSIVPDAADRAALPVQDASGRLAHWKAEIAAHKLRPEPIAQAACRWLEAHIPQPSGPQAIVHGDFRSGNFLVDADNQLLAILDWEMAHVGDPMEDLAWAMDPLWGHSMPDTVAGTCSRDTAIAAWEAASGRRFDAASWNWWRLFAGFQGLAIWITSSFEVAHGRTADPSMIFAGIYPYRFHNWLVAGLLEELSA